MNSKIFVLLFMLAAVLFYFFIKFFYKKMCIYLDEHFDSIHYDHQKNILIGDRFGKRLDLIVNNIIWIPFYLVSILIISICYDIKIGLWVTFLIVCFYIPASIIFLRYDVFKNLSELQEIPPDNLYPPYNEGYALMVIIWATFAIVYFVALCYHTNFEYKYVGGIILFIIIELACIYIDKLNKVLPIKIDNDKIHRYYCYLLVLMLYGIIITIIQIIN